MSTTSPHLLPRRFMAATALLSITGLSGGCTTSALPSLSDTTLLTGLALAGGAAWCLQRANGKLRRELEKRARELVISEERHRLLLNQAGDAIIVADADTGVIIEANKVAHDLMGWGATELLGRTHTTLHPSSHRAGIRGAFVELLTKGQMVEVDTQVVHRSGELIPVNARATLITIGAGRYMQAILRDLRPKLKAEAALQVSQGRLREVEDRWELAVMGLNVGIFEQNYLTGETYLSDRWKEMLGFAPDELPTTREAWQTRVHPEDRDRVLAALHGHLAKENEFYQVDYRILCKDGTYKWIHARGRAVFDDKGMAVRLIGAHADISERKKAESALRESETRYRRLFEDNPCPMWVYDLETLKFLAVNLAAVRHYGYTAQEFLTMSVLDIRPEEEAERLRTALSRWSRAGSMPGLWKHRRKDGAMMLMRVTAHAHEFSGRPAVLVLVEDVTERHEAEERLRTSEARYRTLFESAVEGVYEVDGDGIFRSVNPALARILGYDDPKHMLGTVAAPGSGFYFKEGRRNDFMRTLGGRDELTGFESEVMCGDGSRRWISESVRAVKDPRGNILRLQGFVSDITERKNSEEALRASEERYRVLFEHSPVAIIEQDYRLVMQWLDELRAAGVVDLADYLEKHPDELQAAYGKVLLTGMNRETLRMAQAESKRELMENIERVFTEDAFKGRKQTFLNLWAGTSEAEGEVALHSIEGDVRRVFYRWWMPTIDGRTNPEWAQLVLLDVTDIRAAEAELAAEQERLRVTLRAMAEGLLTTDTDGIVQFMNEAAERITGWASGSAIGRGIEQICVLRHEKTRADVNIPLAMAISEHRVVDFPLQTMVAHRLGGTSLVDGRCAPMHDANGQAIGAVVVLRDVTERSRLEAELLRSSKLESVGILAGGIAHDFNNILTVVMGNVTLAMLDTTINESVGRWLEEAERAVLRARDLTQQLLTFAKGGEPVRKAVLLPDVVREAAEFALHGSKVRSVFEIAKELWPADVDKGQIGQVVQNLVINAVQAMPEGGVVHVSVSNERSGEGAPPILTASKHYLKLSIKDGGVGIKPDHLARIFDPYFTTKQSGSGLGLATVYSIVRKHQGHIEVESEMGKGTAFHIWLPAVPDARPVRETEDKTIVSMAGRVLFMDDEPGICEMANTLLKLIGFQVTTKLDGASALAAYLDAMEKGEPYRLVIMDLTVPGGMGGRETMLELLRIDPHVRAIVSSGYSSDPVLSNYRAHGFRGMVPKPYKITDLARTIRSVLQEP